MSDVKEEILKEKPQEKKKDAPKSKKPQTLIYVGPNLQGGVLSQYTTFRGGLPEHIEALKEKYEGFDKLFVEPAALTAFEQKVKQVGTVQYQAYQNALQGGK